MSVRFKTFTSVMKTWDKLFSEAAEFATRIGPDRLIGISHSQETSLGVVTVWYWDGDEDARPGPG